MARLTSAFWTGAYIARLAQHNIPAFVTAKGDATAGNVMVKLNTLDGNACAFQRSFDATGKRIWITLAEGTDVEVEAALARQRRLDPDIWIIEVEDRAGRHLLDEPGLAD
ncbi:MAG: DUF1491 family protein [Paracoccaceae bacterium]